MQCPRLLWLRQDQSSPKNKMSDKENSLFVYDNPRMPWLQLCPEVQIMVLSFALQPPRLAETLQRDDFPFTKSVIPYVVSYSPLKVASKGILRVNRYFRTVGLAILFKDAAYAPVCLCVRWFHRLSYLDLYAHVGYLDCSYKRQILLSQFEQTSFLGISYWTRLVLPMRLSRSGIDTELRTLAGLIVKMTSLESIHLILILPSKGSDWEVLLHGLRKLKFLDHISFTVHCTFPWYEPLRASALTLTTPSGRAYVPVVNINTVRFEGTNLSKGDGLGDLKRILSHTAEVRRQISWRSRRNGWPSSRVSQIEALAAE
jgi:hypothetical protein